MNENVNFNHFFQESLKDNLLEKLKENNLNRVFNFKFLISLFIISRLYCFIDIYTLYNL